MDATLPFRWRRSPSHGKCSRRFCGSLRNYGRSHHQHQRETLDGHALKSNRREECVLMPAKMSRSAPRPPFRLREVSIAVRTLRLSCRKAGKAPIFTPVRESSGESRLKGSTELYDRIGDLNAYSQVQRHFERLMDVTIRHRGAVIKTIGDAVMAAFLKPADAVEAALRCAWRSSDSTRHAPSATSSS